MKDDPPTPEFTFEEMRAMWVALRGLCEIEPDSLRARDAHSALVKVDRWFQSVGNALPSKESA